jgi:tetratricopeptide (TPR) repeat protein
VEEVLAAARRDLTWAQSRGELRLEATALSVIARCEAMIGASSTVPGLVTDLERLDERVGRDAAAGEFWSEFAAEALLLAGELERAEARLRWMCETLTRAEVSDDVSLSLCWLGEVAYARGRSAEAEALAQRVEVMPILAGKESEIRWRKLLAKARGRRGEAAEDLAWAAVEIARSTDLTNLRADALHDLGEVLTFAGRASEAVGAFREAHALYQRKGNRVSGAVVRKRLDELVGA